MKFFLLKFPVKLINNWQFNYKYTSNLVVLIHIHDTIKLFIKINNFLFNMLNYKLIFYKKIIKKSVKSISILNRSNIKKRKQKGIGKSRIGTLKSSLYKGGGVIFGPHPSINNLKINSIEWIIIYKSFLINKRNNIMWVYINKNIINYFIIEFFMIFLNHLGIEKINNILFIIFSKQLLFKFNFNKKLFFIRNINILNFLLNKYIIYFI